MTYDQGNYKFVKKVVNFLLADYGATVLKRRPLETMTNLSYKEIWPILIEFHKKGYITLYKRMENVSLDEDFGKINTYIETCPFGDDYKTPFNPKNALPQEEPSIDRLKL